MQKFNTTNGMFLSVNHNNEENFIRKEKPKKSIFEAEKLINSNQAVKKLPNRRGKFVRMSSNL